MIQRYIYFMCFSLQSISFLCASNAPVFISAIKNKARQAALRIYIDDSSVANPLAREAWKAAFPGDDLEKAASELAKSSTSTSAPVVPTESKVISALGATVDATAGKRALGELFTTPGESGNNLLKKIYGDDATKVAAEAKKIADAIGR